MKKTIFVIVVAFACGSVFGATTANSSAVQSSEQLQIMQGQGYGLGQASSTAEGGQASSVAGGGESSSSSSAQGGTGGEGGTSTSILVFNPETNTYYRVPDPLTPLPGAIAPPLPFYYPSQGQIVFGNEWKTDVRWICRKWKREEVNTALREYGLNLPRKYRSRDNQRGFKWGAVLFDYRNPPVEEVEVRINSFKTLGPNGQPVTVVMENALPEKISREFSMLGDISVTGSRGKEQIIAFLIGLRLAMDNGIEMVLLNTLGMNTVHKGGTFSPVGGAGHAAPSYSLIGIGGFSSSTAKGEGEPVVSLTPFKKNGKHPLPPPTTTPARRGRTPQPSETTRPPAEDPKKLPPEVISPPQSNASPKDNWAWGIQTSDEARRRASDESILSIQRTIEMSPSFR